MELHIDLTAPRVRCTWAESDPLLVAHHDEEWGVPELVARALWSQKERAGGGDRALFGSALGLNVPATRHDP